MTGKELLNAVAHGRTDLIQVLLEILEEAGAAYCVIDGLAVNAYAEPVVSLPGREPAPEQAPEGPRRHRAPGGDPAGARGAAPPAHPGPNQLRRPPEIDARSTRFAA